MLPGSLLLKGQEDDPRHSALDLVIRPLRTCDEFVGQPISHLFLSPNGRRLGVLTKVYWTV